MWDQQVIHIPYKILSYKDKMDFKIAILFFFPKKILSLVIKKELPIGLQTPNRVGHKNVQRVTLPVEWDTRMYKGRLSHKQTQYN